MIIKFRRREHPYALIDKAGLTDSRLSYRARGILACCMTMPPKLRVSMQYLVENSTDGAKSVRAGFRELAASGYAKLERVRDRHGHVIGTQWVVYESPDLLVEDQNDDPPR